MSALQRRLAAYKANTAKMAERYPESAHYSNWRNNRYPKPAILKRGQHTRSKVDESTIYADCFNDLPLIQVGEAHDICRHLPQGWYTSDDGWTGETLHGFVLAFRNPHKLNDAGAHLFYLAATRHSDWDGVTVYTDSVHDTAEDAARYADECARIDAEEQREADAIYQQEQRIIEAREELHRTNKTTLELIRETKAAQPLSPAICAAVRQTIRAYLADRAELLQTIKTGA
jgi:hypothetical protein